ncbi:MAG: Ig-like domain-containing protein [Verrucomicrobia bacterium]|nr:Ig-like domain-containing protein [Verrucomicrobiota bacterium]
MRRLIWFLLTLTVCAAGPAQAALPSRTNDTPGFVYTVSPEDWRDHTIYQVLTDRFYDGNPANNNASGNYNPSGAFQIHGGDFAGLKEKLDYIKMLGISTVWISPVLQNSPATPHGYSTWDFGAIDPHWGTLQELCDFVDAAHDQGIYVIIDMVVNHMADRIDSTDSGFPAFRYPSSYTPRWTWPTGNYPAPFNDLSLFHMHGNTYDYGDTTQALYGDFQGADSLNTERSDVRIYLQDFYKDLIAATDCDGFRVDTAKHVEMGFWEEFFPSVRSFAQGLGKSNLLVFCEATAAESEIGPYTYWYDHPTYGNWIKFNSALNFPFVGEMEYVFLYDGPTTRLTRYHLDGWQQVLGYYSDEAKYQLANFIDNHDRSRSLSHAKLNNDWNRLKVSLGFLFNTLQLPILYYGTEQGFDGENDPANREDMWDGQYEQGPSLGDNFNYTHPLFVYIRKLNLIKQAYQQLKRGGFTARWEDFDSRGLYVFSRDYDFLGEVIVAVNTSPWEEWVDGAETTYAYDTELANLLNTSERIHVGHFVDAGHKIRFSMPGHSVKIFFNSAYVQALPPSIVGQSPGHSETDVSRSRHLVLSFDQPMDTGSVVSAFSITPSQTGAFDWQDNNTRVTFMPAGLYEESTICTVKLASTASGTNGLPIGADFVSFFETGTNVNTTSYIAFQSTQTDVIEKDLIAVITLTRTNSTFGTGTVQFATSDGSAVANADYMPVTGSVSFADGQLQATFEVPVLHEMLPESDETVNLHLFDPSGDTFLGSMSNAILRILDWGPTSAVRIVKGSPTVSVPDANQNVPGENFDLELNGGYLSTTLQGGFGSFGKIYLNYDTNRLYLGGLDAEPAADNHGMALFIGLNTLTDDRSNLWNNSGQPNGLDLMHNVGFDLPMDIAVVIGDEWGDTNYPSFGLGSGYDFGQGIFYLGGSSFVPVPDISLAQYDGTSLSPVVGADDDANRLVDRWEASVPWARLNAAGMHSVTQILVAGVIANDSVSGNDRFLSGNVLAESVSGTLSSGNYGFGFITLSPIQIDLTYVDSDGDRMRDVYERENGFDPGDPSDGTEDADSDLFLNWMEHDAGTNPHSSTSLLEVIVSQPTGGVTRTIHWPSVAGKSYDVYRATQLTPPNFVLIAPREGATAPENTFKDTVDLPEETFLYKIRLSD